MQFNTEEVLQPQSLALANSEKIANFRLILSAGKNPFFNLAAYANNLQESLARRYKRAITVESSDIIADSITSIQKLIRMIPGFDSIQLIYDGTASFSKSIMPAAVISRFFGKGVDLFYYPDQIIDEIPLWHRRVMSLCSQVYVGTRYLQRELSRYNVKSEVMLPPVNIDLLPVRAVTKIQPHILLKQNVTTDAGTICAMKAVTMVKQKYPRTELSVLIENLEDWLDSDIDAELFVQPCDCTISFVPEKFHENFAKADVFINCSPSETVPSALLAAMASGLPAISFETYGAREIIENGINGLLIRHNDHNQLADEIIRLIEEPSLVQPISKEAANIRGKLSVDNIARLVQ